MWVEIKRLSSFDVRPKAVAEKIQSLHYGGYFNL